jgi:hypothetical protein
MDNLFLSAMLAVNTTDSLARSALPDAPVVPDTPRRRPVVVHVRTDRPRAALARSLERLAHLVAPAPGPGTCHPAA